MFNVMPRMYWSVIALCFFTVSPPPPTIQDAIKLSQIGDYEASEKIMKTIKPTNSTYYFYRLVNAFSLNNKEEGMKWASLVEDTFNEEVPQRYKDLTFIMKADMGTWKSDDDDLDDISREMKKASDRLKNNKGGSETQKIQKNIAKRLEKMIKKLETPPPPSPKEKENKKEEDDSTPPAPKRGEDDATLPPAPPSDPATDTQPHQKHGLGEVDRKRLREVAQVWGKLPPKERARVMQELTRDLPARDRGMIQEYIRRLSGKKK
jgi:hypothetical protein